MKSACIARWVVVLLLAFACVEAGPPILKPHETAALPTEPAAEKPLELEGTLVPAREFNLKAQVSGPVLKLYVAFGAYVKAGDLLMEIRETAGHSPSAISKVLAPAAGVVISMLVTQGQVVTAGGKDGGTPLLVIADDSDYFVEARVNPANASRLALKQTVPVKVDAFPFLPFEAVVTSIVPITDAAGSVKGYTVRARVTPPDSRRLKMGMTAQLMVPGSKKG